MNATILRIAHVPDSSPPQFRVLRASDLKSSDPIELTPPAEVSVEGRQEKLPHQLQWYLEEFLEYPFSPQTDQADHVLDALKGWGRDTFTALFGGGRGRDFYRDATKDDPASLVLQIEAEDPGLLSWPWETLIDPEAGPLASSARIERRLNQHADPLPIPETLPKVSVNILLVTARPYDHDVAYRSISRPLLDLVEKQQLPANVTLLRPPTLERLREHLSSERPGHYHILHFDGHGSYRVHDKADDNVDTHRLSRPEGHLIFEDATGEPDPITAETLSTLLREHRIPAVVLNACQSAMADDRAADPFASVAASLLKAGIRSVVAMGWSLYVSAAQEFLPAFYRRLFETGQFPEAVRAGRQQLLAQKKRVCARGRYELEDWVVPVLYQQDVFELDFLHKPLPTAGSASTLGVAGVEERGTSDEPPEPTTSALPEDAVDTHNPYGFIGRDAAVLALERAMHRPPAGLLIHGLGGVGKTTLARGFIHWLLQTDGVQAEHVFWFRFADDVRTAEYVFNRLGERFFGDKFLTLETARKREALTSVLREHPLLIVWDNFEVVRGIDFGTDCSAGGSVHAAMDSAQQSELKQFLAGLRGGKTRVLITSRSDEAWLGATNRFHIPLGGLKGEELWDYCTAILHDFNFKVDRNDPELSKLLKLLDGHPLTMRAVLPELERRSLTSIIESLEKNLAGLPQDDADIGSESRLYATLGFLTASVPDELQELRISLSLHERYVEGRLLHMMAKQVDEAAWPREKINRFLSALCRAGLLCDIGQSIYKMHPLLSRFLRALNLPDPDDCWHRAFVDTKGKLAGHSSKTPDYEQRAIFQIHGSNFDVARHESKRLKMEDDFGALTQSLALFASRQRRFSQAAELFADQAAWGLRRNREDVVAAAYHQLGEIDEQQHKFSSAVSWCHKSLEIETRIGNHFGIAQSNLLLGKIAAAQRDFPAAENRCRTALEIHKREENDFELAAAYGQLGLLLLDQQKIDSAKECFEQSLEISQSLQDDTSVANACHNLGMIAHRQREFPAAESWYTKSLAITEDLGAPHDAASTYHQLGILAQQQQDFPKAIKYYHSALECYERIGDRGGMSGTFHHLATLAADQGDFPAAECWCYKSLEISKALGDLGPIAATFHQLGIIAQRLQNPIDAERWYRKSLEISEQSEDEHGAAQTWHQLGRALAEQQKFEAAETLFERALSVFEQLEDSHSSAVVENSLARLAEMKKQDLKGEDTEE